MDGLDIEKLAGLRCRHTLQWYRTAHAINRRFAFKLRAPTKTFIEDIRQLIGEPRFHPRVEPAMIQTLKHILRTLLVSDAKCYRAKCLSNDLSLIKFRATLKDIGHKTGWWTARSENGRDDVLELHPDAIVTLGDVLYTDAIIDVCRKAHFYRDLTGLLLSACECNPIAIERRMKK